MEAVYTKLQIDSYAVSVNRVSSRPTFSYYSYFGVLFLPFPTFLLKVPTTPTFLLSNAKMMIGLRKAEIT